MQSRSQLGKDEDGREPRVEFSSCCQSIVAQKMSLMGTAHSQPKFTLFSHICPHPLANDSLPSYCNIFSSGVTSVLELLPTLERVQGQKQQHSSLAVPCSSIKIHAQTLQFGCNMFNTFKILKIICHEKSSITQLISKIESESRSVVSDSLRPRGLYSSWNSPGQNTGVGSCSLLQGIFPTQESNPGLLHCRQIPYQLSHEGSSK